MSVPAERPFTAFQPVAAATSNDTVYVPTAEGAFVFPLYLTATAPMVLPSLAVTVTVLVVPSKVNVPVPLMLKSATVGV